MITKIDEPKINKRIVLLFLEKLEVLELEERKEILRMIKLLNYPVYKIEEESLSKEELDILQYRQCP